MIRELNERGRVIIFEHENERMLIVDEPAPVENRSQLNTAFANFE